MDKKDVKTDISTEDVNWSFKAKPSSTDRIFLGISSKLPKGTGVSDMMYKNSLAFEIAAQASSNSSMEEAIKNLKEKENDAIKKLHIDQSTIESILEEARKKLGR